MKKYQKFVVALLTMVLCMTAFNPISVGAKEVKTKVYCFYASTADKFQLSNGKLTIKLDDNYDISLLGDYDKIKNKENNSIDGKKCKSNKMTYKVDKNCKWRIVSVCDKFSKDGDKTSYKQVKENIQSTKTDDWDFGVLVYVRGKKIIKVAERFS